MEKKYNTLIKYHKALITTLIKKVKSNSKSSKQIPLRQLVKYTSSNLSLNDLVDSSGMYPLYGADGFVKNIDFYEMDEEYIGIVKDGAGVGRIIFNKNKSSILGTMGYLTSNKEINLKYVYYYLNTIIVF